MHFSIQSFAADSPEKPCYFSMYSDELLVHSPFYPNHTEALEGMKKLVLRLRLANSAQPIKVRKSGAGYSLTLFDKAKAAVGKSTVDFETKEAAERALDNWQAAALATTFRVLHRALTDWPEGLTELTELDFSTTDAGYSWQEKGSSLLHVPHAKSSIQLPNMGLQLGVDEGPCEQVFCGLEPFTNANIALFHGRNREVDEVDAMLRDKPLLLLYGAARVGKTSLLQCGLANRLNQETECMIVVQKGQADLLTTLIEKLRSAITPTPTEDLALVNDPMVLANRLAQQFTKRIFLVFDQLEQLFDNHILDTERASLFRFIREIVQPKNTPFRVVTVMREEFLAPLVDFENELPQLLHNRFRLRSLNEGSMVNATANLLDILKLGEKIDVDDPRVVSAKICAQLVDENGNVPMHCLQVYLHQLHQKSCQETKEGPVPMTPEVIDRMWPAKPLINTFFARRIEQLKGQLPKENEAPNPLLERQIMELENSRLDCGCEKNQSVTAAAATPLPVPVGILGWASALAIAVLPLGLYFLYGWLFPGPQSPSACELVKAENNCSAYVNYLCTHGEEEDEECLAEIREILAEQDCDIWRDYQALEQQANCASYQQFYDVYRDRNICMDRIQSRLLEWGCPIVRDTVQLTVHDTVIQLVPTAPSSGPSKYGTNPVAPPSLSVPCRQIGNATFKQVGPLWIMTEALNNGNYSWEDALDACTSKGWRLPCIGEIDFLIEKIYRDDPNRAFAMLTGSGDCALVNPADNPSGRIEFWTATEANDATAWSYYFDMPLKTIGRQSSVPKSARMPCLCVEREARKKGSGLPPCYQKSVDRVPGK